MAFHKTTGSLRTGGRSRRPVALITLLVLFSALLRTAHGSSELLNRIASIATAFDKAGVVYEGAGDDISWTPAADTAQPPTSLLSHSDVQAFVDQVQQAVKSVNELQQAQDDASKHPVSLQLYLHAVDQVHAAAGALHAIHRRLRQPPTELHVESPTGADKDTILRDLKMALDLLQDAQERVKDAGMYLIHGARTTAHHEVQAALQEIQDAQRYVTSDVDDHPSTTAPLTSATDLHTHLLPRMVATMHAAKSAFTSWSDRLHNLSLHIKGDRGHQGRGGDTSDSSSDGVCGAAATAEERVCPAPGGAAPGSQQQRRQQAQQLVSRLETAIRQLQQHEQAPGGDPPTPEDTTAATAAAVQVASSFLETLQFMDDWQQTLLCSTQGHQDADTCTTPPLKAAGKAARTVFDAAADMARKVLSREHLDVSHRPTATDARVGTSPAEGVPGLQRVRSWVSRKAHDIVQSLPRFTAAAAHTDEPEQHVVAQVADGAAEAYSVEVAHGGKVDRLEVAKAEARVSKEHFELARELAVEAGKEAAAGMLLGGEAVVHSGQYAAQAAGSAVAAGASKAVHAAERGRQAVAQKAAQALHAAGQGAAAGKDAVAGARHSVQDTAAHAAHAVKQGVQHATQRTQHAASQTATQAMEAAAGVQQAVKSGVDCLQDAVKAGADTVEHHATQAAAIVKEAVTGAGQQGTQQVRHGVDMAEDMAGRAGEGLKRTADTVQGTAAAAADGAVAAGAHAAQAAKAAAEKVTTAAAEVSEELVHKGAAAAKKLQQGLGEAGQKVHAGLSAAGEMVQDVAHGAADATLDAASAMKRGAQHVAGSAGHAVKAGAQHAMGATHDLAGDVLKAGVTGGAAVSHIGAGVADAVHEAVLTVGEKLHDAAHAVGSTLGGVQDRLQRAAVEKVQRGEEQLEGTAQRARQGAASAAQGAVGAAEEAAEKLAASAMDALSRDKVSSAAEHMEHAAEVATAPLRGGRLLGLPSRAMKTVWLSVVGAGSSGAAPVGLTSGGGQAHLVPGSASGDSCTLARMELNKTARAGNRSTARPSVQQAVEDVATAGVATVVGAATELHQALHDQITSGLLARQAGGQMAGGLSIAPKPSWGARLAQWALGRGGSETQLADTAVQRRPAMWLPPAVQRVLGVAPRSVVYPGQPMQLDEAKQRVKAATATEDFGEALLGERSSAAAQEETPAGRAHNQLHAEVLATLQAVRTHLVVHGFPTEACDVKTLCRLPEPEPLNGGKDTQSWIPGAALVALRHKADTMRQRFSAFISKETLENLGHVLHRVFAHSA